MPEIRQSPSGPLLRVPLDLPAGLLSDRVGAMPGAALLEGGRGFGAPGRWSILAACPIGSIRSGHRLDRWRADLPAPSDRAGADRPNAPPAAPSVRGDPLGALAGVLRRFGLDRGGEDRGAWGEDLPPFLGGLIGYYSYDLAPALERLPRKASREWRFRPFAFRLYDTFVAIDHDSGEASLWATAFRGESPGDLERRARGWLDRLREARWIRRSRLLRRPTSNFTPEGYRDAVARAVGFIHAGDIFQANISQRFLGAGPIDPIDLYRRLRERSPSPYAAFLGLGQGDPQQDLAVISSSPELFFETRGDRIVTRPIKGTRPRGATPRADADRIAELIGSAKDRAELAMIVDLERNDLGRVCAFGTVKVAEPSVIESYATVHHQVATIEGRLRPGVGPIDVIRAVFPGGSITGAPKIRAMEIIDELEPTRRSLYTGAIGYYSRGGVSAFNIAIRTMLVEGMRVSYQVGGGIVADSDPQLEYEETMHKGRAMREVLEGSS